MTEQGQTSSMTSVTEEDMSGGSESDTTESYSNITSSVLSSSDYNTDDKLTPSLISISISKSHQADHLHRSSTFVAGTASNRSNSASITASSHMDGAKNKPSSKSHSEKCHSQANNVNKGLSANLHKYKKQKDHHSSVVTKQPPQQHSHKMFKPAVKKQTGCSENMGLDDPDNKLMTDLSDTSSRQRDEASAVGGNGSENDVVSSVTMTSRRTARRPHFPNLASRSWFQAGCFDRYWSHYRFVMEWYQRHVQAVNMLQRQYGTGGTMGFHGCDWSHHGPTQRGNHSHRARKTSRAQRARNRRLAKEKRNEEMKATGAELGKTSSTDGAPGHQVDGDNDKCSDMEMEITEDMLEFFTTSFKHRMERDSKKDEDGKGSEELRVNIEEAGVGQHIRSVSAPSERPGVRRAAEMKYLYGTGAPMIHGMETALQLTFDRVTDRHQPKLWPNMPLKLIFS